MHLLFVCTGNTCRSPMAEGIARRLAASRELGGLEVRSAGTFAQANTPASDGALLVALEQGIDLSTHRSQELTADLVEWADVILAMGPNHRDRAEALGGEGKSYVLREYASHGQDSRPVSDPFGGELHVYRETFDELTHEIGDVLDRVVHERHRRPA